MKEGCIIIICGTAARPDVADGGVTADEEAREVGKTRTGEVGTKEMGEAEVVVVEEAALAAAAAASASRRKAAGMGGGKMGAASGLGKPMTGSGGRLRSEGVAAASKLIVEAEEVETAPELGGVAGVATRAARLTWKNGF